MILFQGMFIGKDEVIPSKAPTPHSSPRILGKK